MVAIAAAVGAEVAAAAVEGAVAVSEAAAVAVTEAAAVVVVGDLVEEVTTERVAYGSQRAVEEQNTPIPLAQYPMVTVTMLVLYTKILQHGRPVCQKG